MVAVVGATGYVGRLISAEVGRRGIPFVAVGRSREKLEALPGAADRRVADTSDEHALREALDGCRAVCSCVGPFVDHGEPVVRTAIDAGVNYLDMTGEQAFVRTIFERCDAPARKAGVALVPAMGVDPLLGDMAAALAARALGATPDAVEVFHLEIDATASDGTKRTVMRVAPMPCWTWRDGRPVLTAIGADGRRFRFPGGDSHVAVFPAPEVLTISRHTGARDVSCYIGMPRLAARIARGARLASPLLRVGRVLLGSRTGGPSPEQRARHRYAKVAEARAGGRPARCVVEGSDSYGVTAAGCVEALVLMADAGFDGRGVLAPSEAFDPEAFLAALGDHLSWRIE
jgi:short subunit dehydrogenase-like uncharacterized protein